MLEKIHHKSAPKEVVNALVTLYHQGKFDDVLSRSSQLIKEYPQTFVLHNIIGAISFEKGQKEEAIKHFRKVIELRPHHPHAYNNLGAALIDIGEYEEAKSNLKKAIELQPDYAEAYNNLGNVYKEMEEYNQAISVYEKAIELNPEYYEAYNNLGVVLGKNEQYEEAEKVLKQVIQINPKFQEAYVNLGVILTNAIKHQESKKILMQGLKINPKNANIFFHIGIIYSIKNLPKIAIRYFKKAINFDANNANIYYNLSLEYTKVGLLSKAADNLKTCLKIEPNHQSALHVFNSLTGRKTKTAPRDYITGLFDYYANYFEKSLINDLDYKIPKEIKSLLLENSLNSLGSVMDLGCGTGLVGLELNKNCNYIEGIDLSTNMINEARKKNVYDKLIKTEIIDYLTNNTLNFDYFLAADVFIYIGDLYEVFRLIKKRNQKIANLVFSIELTTADDYILEKSGRYSHSTNYISSLCNEFDLTITNFKKLPIRKEKKQYIPGALYNLSF